MPPDTNKHYKPLPKWVTIKESPIEGLGLFATTDIPVGEELGCTHVWLEAEKTWLRSPLGGFYNHVGKNPTCVSEERNGKKFLKTLRDIKKGEELTATYKMYDPTN